MKRPAPAFLLPAAVALLAALPSIFPGFIHDDHRLIEQNRLVQETGRLPEILARGYWTVDDREVPNLYRPVTILSFALNRLATGPGAFGFRVVDLLLHVLVTGLVYCVSRRIIAATGANGIANAGPGAGTGTAVSAAMAAALLFAAHPVHTEALGLVVGRSELLMALFTLWALKLFLDGARVAPLLLVPLAMFSKESGVAAPFLLLAADRLRPKPRASLRFHGLAFGVLVVCLAIRSFVLGAVAPQAFTHFIDNPIAHLPWPRSLFTALAALWRDVVLLVWPWNLSIDYSYVSIPEAASLFDPRACLGAGAALLVALGVPHDWRRRPAAAFALLLLALPLLPVANLLMPIGTILAERLLYLPSAGLCLFWGLAYATAQADTRPGRRRLVVAVLAVVIAAGVVRSAWRYRDWADDRTIWAAAVRLYPDNVRARFNYGAASERAHDDAEAERAYRHAVEVWPQFGDAHYNLAGVLGRAGRWREAGVEYRAALEDQPGNVTYLVNAGHAAAQAGELEGARTLLERAVELDRTSAPAWTDLGAVRLQAGDSAGALAAWNEAARLAPGDPEKLANLALAHEAAGRNEEAVEAWRAVVAGRPQDPIMRYRLGRALERAGHKDEAAASYRESMGLAPDSPVPLKALGLLLASQGDADGARGALQRARALDPGGQVMDAAAIRVLESLEAKPGARPPPAGPSPPSDGPARN
ncbi:MAG TPA: tetratricopeptide repeat protein [Verrucomicrobiae bacterium]|nr:tetratricopeptide repeat protein [Verrucomicrobiae bacterium]